MEEKGINGPRGRHAAGGPAKITENLQCARNERSRKKIREDSHDAGVRLGIERVGSTPRGENRDQNQN